MNKQLGFSYPILNDSYAAGCGTLCLGGIIMIPFALKYGRRPIYILSMAFQMGMSIWSAKMQTVADLMLINLLSCLVGALAEIMVSASGVISCSIGIVLTLYGKVQMTVADMYFVHERGRINTSYYWVQSFGSSLAPLAAGFASNSMGWRWGMSFPLLPPVYALYKAHSHITVWWLIAIFFGVGLVAFTFLYEETMFVSTVSKDDGVEVDEVVSEKQQPISEKQQPIEKRKSIEKQEPIGYKSDVLEKGGPRAGSSAATKQAETVAKSGIRRRSYWQMLKPWSDSGLPLTQLFKHMYTPFLMMFSIPGIFFMALEYGLMTACGTLTTTSQSSVMTEAPYNFSSSGIGLMSLPSFIGVTIGTLVYGPLSDYLALRLSKRNKGVFEPEMRLWPVIIFLPCVPAGIFMFGISLKHKAHWIVPAVGNALMSVGLVPACSSALTYLTDSYTDVS